MDGVSLRQIAQKAGHRNPAVVQYHFGSRAGLLRAIIEYREPSVNERRLQLLEQLDKEDRGLDVRGLVEAMIRPYLEQASDSHYVEFLVRLHNRPEIELEAFFKACGVASGARMVVERLYEALVHLPPAVRENRIQIGKDLTLTAVANNRARRAAGMTSPLTDERFATDVFDAMVGLLCSPQST
jgi:AcrR family transcriptional regulator